MAAYSGKKERSLLPPPALAALSILDYLDQDQRPTFAIDLGSGSLAPTSNLDPVFVNQALRYLELSGKFLLDWTSSIHRAAGSHFHAFASWATRETCDDSIEYAGFHWTAVTVRQTWRFISTSSVLPGRGAATKDISKTTRMGNGYPPRDEMQQSRPPRDNTPAHGVFDVLASLGSASLEHCRLISNYDWASTPVGPIVTWPRLLIQTIPYLLCNTEPSVIFWGQDRTMIYNESYPTLIKDFHPGALGSSAKITFATIWAPFESLTQQIEQTRRAVKHRAVRVVLNRSGTPEEAYFNYAFMPLLEADGRVGGIHNHVQEVTKQVVTERQMSLLIKIGESTASSTTLSELWRCFFDAVQDCFTDLPFMAVYSRDSTILASDPASGRSSKGSDHSVWHLEGSVGFPKDHPAVAQTLNMSGEEGLAPILRLASTHSSPLSIDSEHPLLSDDLKNRCIDRGVGSSYTRMVVCPLTLSTEGTAAFIVIGISPLRPFNDDYTQLVNLLSRQMEDTATSVMLSMREKRHHERTVEQAEHQRQWLSEQLLQQTKEARQSELRFYNFAKQAPVGVYILGSEGEIKYCNDAWYGLVGIPIGFQGPIPWRIHVHPEDLEAVDQQWELLKKGKSQSNFEWRAVRDSKSDDDDGKDIVYLRSSSFPQLREDGSIETVTGILMDLSVHKAHEREVADRLATALEAKRSQENFMDMVSHEMRNPLNAMLQCAGEAYQLLQPLIAGSFLASEIEAAATNALEAIDTIQYCGRHQKQIIDDVLTISKLDSNLLTLCPVTVTPADVVGRAVKIFTSEIRAAEIEITQEIDPAGSHSPCLMDSNRILQILINLIGNAIKFLRERPVRKLALSVRASTTKPSRREVKFIPSGRQRKPQAEKMDWGSGHPIYIYFSVTDTGPGLTSAEMDTLFARFKQASPRTHAQYGGSGLGLFISRELVELHRGEIGLTSQVGKGSTFAFYVQGRSVVKTPAPIDTSLGQKDRTEAVPRAKSISSGLETFALASPASTSRTPPESMTVLVVEDNIVNQKVLQRQLKRLGYKVMTANHGLEALELVQRSHWCLDGGPTNSGSIALSIILCDLEMPVMDGMACVREIRRRQRTGSLRSYIPMVAVTGNARAEQVHAAKDAGFDDVVCKPYNVPDLIPLMHELVEAEGAPPKRARIATD